MPGLAAEAVLAGAAPVAAAGTAQPEDHPVADRGEPLGARAELLHDADGLVADGLGAHAVPVAPGQVQIGMADAGRGDPHQRMIRIRLRRIDFLDRDLAVLYPCRLHGDHARCPARRGTSRWQIVRTTTGLRRGSPATSPADTRGSR